MIKRKLLTTANANFIVLYNALPKYLKLPEIFTYTIHKRIISESWVWSKS